VARFLIALVPVGGLAVTALVLAVGYLRSVAHDPNHLWLLPHRDVAFARIAQDLALGRPPTIEAKDDELWPQGQQQSDLLVCPLGGYAITHVFLQRFNDRRVLAFCNNEPQNLLDPGQVREQNLRGIVDFYPSGRDLLVVWELSPKVLPVIATLRSLRAPMQEQTLSYLVDGQEVQVLVVTVKAPDIAAFKLKVATLLAATPSKSPST
jgi:hypothetical protein